MNNGLRKLLTAVSLTMLSGLGLQARASHFQGQEIDRLSFTSRMNAEQEVMWKNAHKYPAGQYLARFSDKNTQSLKINKLQ